MRFIVYGNIHDRGPSSGQILVRNRSVVVRVLGKVEYQISVRLTCRVPICVVEAVTVIRICLTSQLEELILVPDVLQEYQIFSV